MNGRDAAFLKGWKDLKNRKPLIINDAKRVGKTWLFKLFGELYFKQMAYINFETSHEGHL
jgi:uncharacterized protein